MKKLHVITIALLLLFASASFGYEVTPIFDLREKGGTSTFATPIDSASAGQDWIATMGDPQVVGSVISSVTAVAAWKAAISGTSVTVSVAVSDSGTTPAMAAAEYTPIWTGELFSGDTDYVVFRIPPLKYLFTRATAGVTVFKLPITFRSWKGVDLDPLPYVVEEGTFTMPASGTGVSQFTAASIGAWPGGVRWASFSPLSGASCFATTDGDTPSAGVGFTIYKDDVLELSKREAKAVQFVTGVEATVIRYQLLTMKP